MEQERNCAFQYAKIESGRFGSTDIVCDKSELTLDEAKALWNEHFRDCASWIGNGNTAEMVIWIDMSSPEAYGKTLEYIDTESESDGTRVWKTERTYFTPKFDGD